MLSSTLINAPPPHAPVMQCRDTEVLCSSLTYDQGPPEILYGSPAGQHMRVYRPPFDEFEVTRLEVPQAEESIIPANQVPASL